MSKRKPADPTIWNYLKRAPAGRGKVGAELVGQRLESVNLSLSGVDVLYLEECRVCDVTLSDFDGDLFLGAGSDCSIFEQVVFRGFRTSVLHFGRADYSTCQFLDLDVNSIRCTDASVTDCVFSGRASRCLFSIDPERRVTDRLAPTPISQNDFSELICGDYDFRGGVSLSVNALRRSASNILVLDLPRAVERIEASGRFQLYTERQVQHLRFVQRFAEIAKQQDLFFGPIYTGGLDAEELRVLVDLQDSARH
jgi:hypothetical protein